MPISLDGLVLRLCSVQQTLSSSLGGQRLAPVDSVERWLQSLVRVVDLPIRRSGVGVWGWGLFSYRLLHTTKLPCVYPDAVCVAPTFHHQSLGTVVTFHQWGEMLGVRVSLDSSGYPAIRDISDL